MKKIINGRRYNTDTARLIGQSVGDGITEALHRKQTGEYFLHVVFGDGETLTPITPVEAEVWAKAHGCSLDIDAYTKLWLKLTPQMAKRLRQYAERNQMSLNSAVIDALKKMLYTESDNHS